MSRTRIKLGLVGVCCGMGLFAQDAGSLAQQGMMFQQESKYEEAAQKYADLLKLVPDDVTTHVNYGVVLVHLNRFREAIAQYQAAEALLPGDPRIELNLALAWEKSGDKAQARKRFTSLHASDPGNAQVTMLLADSCLQAQDYKCVVETLQPLKDSTDLGIAYMLATAFLRTQRSGEAKAYVDRIAGNGESPEVHFLLATQAFESGNFPEAVKQFENASEKAPDFPGLWSMLGRSRLYTGDPDGALNALDLALKADPNEASALLAKAEILTARGQDTEARPLVTHVMQQDPNNAEAQLTAAELLLHARAFSEARNNAEKAVSTLPGDEHAHRILASIYRAEHMDNRARVQDDAADKLAAAADPGPKTTDAAPDFTLSDVATGKAVHLADYRGRSPVALIFGSYSCPNFRASADYLRDMQKHYGSRVPFLLVYVREAHAEGQWQSGRNSREDMPLKQATTMAEKEEHASMCSRKLHLPFPALVDGMDGSVEAAYNAWPSRAYVIAKDGRIAYSTRLSELRFQPERMEAVLQRLSSQ